MVSVRILCPLAMTKWKSNPKVHPARTIWVVVMNITKFLPPTTTWSDSSRRTQPLVLVHDLLTLNNYLWQSCRYSFAHADNILILARPYCNSTICTSFLLFFLAQVSFHQFLLIFFWWSVWFATSGQVNCEITGSHQDTILICIQG